MRDYKILLVDDDLLLLESIGLDLEDKGYRVTAVENGEAAVEELENADFDLVLTDLIMGSVDGIGVLKKAKEKNPETMVIILTGYGDLTSSIDALRLDADDYLVKPCETGELYFRVSRCLEKLELKRRIELYEDFLPVCCACKKIRNDVGREPGSGQWMEVDEYLLKRSKLEITHVYCPECGLKLREEIEGFEKDS